MEDIVQDRQGTQLGRFKYFVMPFGLTNAPAVFQALINDVLRGMSNKFLFVYLDDILIFSEMEEEHLNHQEATPAVPGVCQLLPTSGTTARWRPL